MKLIVKTFFLILIFCLENSCTDRERLNPIDPQNPETEGRLVGLNIYSDKDRAVLQWERLKLNGIQGYHIYRQQHPDSAFHLIQLVSPDSNQYVDYGLDYNKKYAYFVTTAGEDFETPGSDTVSIVPGPTTIWATDVYNRRILKISHDSAHEIEQLPVDGYPWELAYDAENSLLWYTDVFLNRVYTIKSQQSVMVLDIGYGDPIDLAMDLSNNQIWIADQTLGKIYLLNRQGEKIGETSDFQKPVSIDFALKDQSCWVADSKARTVTKISNTFDISVQIKDLIDPSSVAVNQKSGDCWVADSLRLLKFDLNGRLRLAVERPNSFLRYVAFDTKLDYCWVLDVSFFANESRLLCFNNEGDQLLDRSGFSWPENLKVNPYDHNCIVTDSGSGRILKISKDGAIMGQVSGYDHPRGLFIEM